MNNNEEVFALLKRIGLNQYESKVYVAILSHGLSTAGQISDLAAVPRSRVYDVLSSLEKKGFAVVQMGRPIRYMPVAAEEIVDRIKVEYQTEYDNKVKRVDKLKDDIVGALEPLAGQGGIKDPAKFSGLIKGQVNLQRKMEHMIQHSKSHVCKVTTSPNLEHFLGHSEHLKAAADRGVKTKVLVDLAHEHSGHAKKLSDVSEVRHLSGLKGRFLTKDNKETLLMLEPEGLDQSGIWVKSPYLTEGLQHLFDHMWDKGKQI